jgi:hypothetical protein
MDILKVHLLGQKPKHVAGTEKNILLRDLGLCTYRFLRDSLDRLVTGYLSRKAMDNSLLRDRLSVTL